MAGIPKLIGKLESELSNVITGLKPIAVAAVRAAWTSGLESDVLPAGRLPINFVSAFTAILESARFLFSASAPSRTASRNLASILSSSPGLSERRSTSKEHSSAIAFTDVPPLILPTEKVVLGDFGTSQSEMRSMILPAAWIALGRPKFCNYGPPGHAEI